MSSSSDDARYLTVVRGNQTSNCFCSLPSKERDSKKPDNPGRRFYNCAKSLVAPDACNFFMWRDPPLNQHYKDFKKRLNKQLAEMNTSAELDRIQRKLEKQKAMRNKAFARIQELEMEVTQLKVKRRCCYFLITKFLFNVSY